MSSPGRAGRPKASSRETLAEAACELFLERGYDATSVADITQRAGVSRSSFFNYFASKSDVLWSGVDERIGQAIARRARAFGLQIHYHNRRPVAPMIADELGATYWESLDQMLARMDIISVNCPHTPATYHLLSARRLKLIRKEAYIVNTARGEVIDEDTLIKLIEAGDVGGAGLDVYEHEPAVNPKLVRLARAGKVTLLPHMGSATIEGRVEMGEKVIINIRTFLDAHKPPDRVLPSML